MIQKRIGPFQLANVGIYAGYDCHKYNFHLKDIYDNDLDGNAYKHVEY